MSKELNVLIGKTLIEVSNNEDEIIFVISDEEKYKLYHQQDCCESVRVEDICGDLSDLVGEPIITAEEISYSNETPPDFKGTDKDPDFIEAKRKSEMGEDYYHYNDESYTWTFYKFSTIKGSVTIRWYGSSNGYYSERVKFCKVGSEWDWQ